MKVPLFVRHVAKEGGSLRTVNWVLACCIESEETSFYDFDQ